MALDCASSALVTDSMPQGCRLEEGRGHPLEVAVEGPAWRFLVSMGDASGCGQYCPYEQPCGSVSSRVTVGVAILAITFNDPDGKSVPPFATTMGSVHLEVCSPVGSTSTRECNASSINLPTTFHSLQLLTPGQGSEGQDAPFLAGKEVYHPEGPTGHFLVFSDQVVSKWTRAHTKADK